MDAAALWCMKKANLTGRRVVRKARARHLCEGGSTFLKFMRKLALPTSPKVLKDLLYRGGPPLGTGWKGAVWSLGGDWMEGTGE